MNIAKNPETKKGFTRKYLIIINLQKYGELAEMVILIL